jgi:ubiquinone/menaquinone biosynthesis C-methylase UbiE
MGQMSIDDDSRRERWIRVWDRGAPRYDPTMRRLDRLLFRDSRAWVCGQATGDVLEVAIGTGLNLEHYPAGVRLTGVDVSTEMLARARTRVAESGRAVRLEIGDAERLAFADASFDAVVCTFSLCGIPNPRRAVAEMARVLRPGGLLLLADHVASTNPLLRAVQRLAEFASVPLAGEHFRRRPLALVRAAGFEIVRSERFAAGVVERLAATPAPR